ncbi:MAG: metallophosphoesterase [Candidatus Pacebacteria bacterium]|nr:metallophosphoesterase [Candidatus Paceibacterota bacterium]
MINKKRKLFLILTFLVFPIILGWYSFSFEPNNIQIEKINIEIENLPESFDGVKIVHLTDFHSQGFDKREKMVLEMVSQLDPDFVFITGDFVDRKTKDIDSVQEFWQELGDQYKGKIFGVLGNHEYRNKNTDIDSLKETLEKSEITVLDNENQKIYKAEEYVYLVGVDDPHTGRADLEKALADTKGDVPKILLAHSPEIISDLENLREEEIDLVLAGHTHGGQIKIPFIRPFWVPTENRGKYASGLFEINNTYLYVNRGIGLSTFPIRFNCSPEIALIELSKK